uniref:Uncharacterized protein MANES_05G000500 n=1 Tax=Rhizophora mucronata TaxID=61149 RepID=A0A2P2L6V5_RHIMU
MRIVGHIFENRKSEIYKKKRRSVDRNATTAATTSPLSRGQRLQRSRVAWPEDVSPCSDFGDFKSETEMGLCLDRGLRKRWPDPHGWVQQSLRLVRLDGIQRRRVYSC